MLPRSCLALALLAFAAACSSPMEGATSRTDGSPGVDAFVPTDTSGDASRGTDGAAGRDATPSLDAGMMDAAVPGDAAAVTCDPPCAGGEVCVAAACVSELSGVPALDDVLLGDATRFDDEILISQDPDLSWRPSRIYKWRDFVQAVATMYGVGVGELRLWFGDATDSDELRARLGLVNLAAFLAQSMKETIRYDACDENNWDSTNGYQISNACGQLGQRYGDYDCELACPRDPSMQITATTQAAWYGAPGPMFCAPDATLMAAGLSTPEGRTGRWDFAHDCWPYPASEASFAAADEPAWSRSDCEVYSGQRAGRWVWDGSGGSVEGCCWWGRGVIQTTGRCNFGTLDHYLGRGHTESAEHARPATVLYPDVDFCRDPGAICGSAEHPELKWVAGLFYWMSSVQTYDEEGWAYLDALRAFVGGGLVGNEFIDAVSGIVNRGCHSPPCATGAVDGLDDRRAGFDSVLRVMGLR